MRDNQRMRVLGRILLAIIALALVTAVAGGCYVRSQLRASLPQLEGTATLAGLSAPVIIARDTLGVPTITGASRADAARALGFLHAQDRFFQMDLQRRQPAGELSALVGARAFEVDAEIRVHRFRHVAEQAYARTEAEWKAILDAYAAGVNAGLQALPAPSFEYLMLRTAPEPWKPEDSLLTVLAMFISLQGRQGIFEQTNQQLRDALPEPLFRFLTVVGSDWDAPVVGQAMPRPPVPGAEVANLRRGVLAPRPTARVPGTGEEAEEASIIGSNNWAVDAAHSASGHALVANDMHLNIGVPNIWYRASMAFPDPADPLKALHLTGVTLPGLPVAVVGSNGYVAWGFTNTGGDWSDLVRIEPDPRDPSRYLTSEGPRLFDIGEESVAVKGEAPRQVTVRGTIWGPVVWRDAEGREYAQHWVAHDPALLGTDLARPERTRTVDEMIAAFAGLGLPNQNVTMADASGAVAWTIGGAIPRRRGLDGFTPESWADGARGWDGYLDPGEFPRIADPQSGRIWTANARVVDGDMLAKIGDGNYEVGSRARIIRERLESQDRFTAADLLSIQLDTSAEFLTRWRTLLLGELKSVTDQPRIRLREIVERDWDGKASPGSAGYRLTRMFREEVTEAIIAFLLIECNEADATFDYRNVRRREGPIWKLVSEKPMHLLDPEYKSWDALILQAATDVVVRAEREGGLAEPWSTWNITTYRHPLSASLPLVDRWLDMPRQTLPGDLYTPNMHWNANASSERMIVSPGHESEGIMHMPTGQSGHPLSPFYSNSHTAWVNGEATPFLPGPTVYTLTLTP